MTGRRPSLPVRLRDVVIGDGAPVSIQSMTKTDTRDHAATIAQVRLLADSGCDIVRLAVPDMEAAGALKLIRRVAPIPIVADIHFDHRLAIAAMDAGVDGLRLNPGNINRRENLVDIVRHARERSIPIRIGVNGGSLPRDYRPDLPLPERMVALAQEQIGVLEGLDFTHIKVSLKSSNVQSTITAYRLIAQQIPYSLHLGVTEAGPAIIGAVRNALGIGILLSEGIGDTLRVSLSGDPLDEVVAGKAILQSLQHSPVGPSLVSCPTCGRTNLDVPGIAKAVSEYLLAVRFPIRVAVMGCVVNGPGECREADVGIAGSGEKVLVYRNGAFSHSIPAQSACQSLIAEIRATLEEKQRQF